MPNDHFMLHKMHVTICVLINFKHKIKEKVKIPVIQIMKKGKKIYTLSTINHCFYSYIYNIGYYFGQRWTTQTTKLLSILRNNDIIMPLYDCDIE